MQLFLDMDGVLADFDGYYRQQFGVSLDRRSVQDPPGMWENIRSHGRFYRAVPPMADARQLLDATRHLNPIILTGVPRTQVPEAEEHKREWLAEHFGADLPIICCRSSEKRLHGKPGDVLVDDWFKYRHLWEEMGGTFVLHTSAAESIARIEELWA